MPSDALSVPPTLPVPLRAAGFGFTLGRITVRPSRTRFAGRLNSGVRRSGEDHGDMGDCLNSSAGRPQCLCQLGRVESALLRPHTMLGPGLANLEPSNCWGDHLPSLHSI